MIKALIMAGGSGNRLWPLSRAKKPKQCLALVSEKSLLEDAVERMEWVTDRENILIVTTSDLEKQLQTMVSDIPYVIEPVGRGTAASIGLGLLAQKGNPLMVVGTADHAIQNPDIFAQEVKQACALAESGNIVLFGIPPTRPETGYGYIKKGDSLPILTAQAFTVAEFKEKPGYATAQKYHASGKYLWNSGMFIAKKNVLLEGIEKYCPLLWKGLATIKEYAFDPAVVAKVFSGLETVSIDKGVIEKSTAISVVRASFPWDDVGDFLALSRLYPKDTHGNVVRAAYQGNATDSVILSNGRVIYANRVRNLVLVDTGDVVLVCAKDRTQDVAKLVTELKRDARFFPYTVEIQNPCPRSYCFDGQNMIQSTCFVATVGVTDIEILVNAHSVMINGNR